MKNLLSEEKPNLVFILADQLRATSLPLYGENQIETTHIDRLAADGAFWITPSQRAPFARHTFQSENY